MLQVQLSLLFPPPSRCSLSLPPTHRMALEKSGSHAHRPSERALPRLQAGLPPPARSLPNCVASNSPLVQSRDGSSLLPRPHSLTPLEPTLNSHGGQARVLISALSDARSPGNNSALIGTGHGQTIQVLISILLNTSIPRRSHFQDIFLLRVLSLTISRHF